MAVSRGVGIELAPGVVPVGDALGLAGAPEGFAGAVLGLVVVFLFGVVPVFCAMSAMGNRESVRKKMRSMMEDILTVTGLHPVLTYNALSGLESSIFWFVEWI